MEKNLRIKVFLQVKEPMKPIKVSVFFFFQVYINMCTADPKRQRSQWQVPARVISTPCLQLQCLLCQHGRKMELCNFLWISQVINSVPGAWRRINFALHFDCREQKRPNFRSLLVEINVFFPLRWLLIDFHLAPARLPKWEINCRL